MNVDKIPIELLQESPGDETFKLGTLELTKAEYANAEKTNEIIDWCRVIQTRLEVLENK